MSYLDQDRSDAPEFLTLWDRTQAARKPYVCDTCKEPIAIGTRYRSIGQRVDGVFDHLRLHPGICPKEAERESAEMEAQFERDARELFGASA